MLVDSTVKDFLAKVPGVIRFPVVAVLPLLTVL